MSHAAWKKEENTEAMEFDGIHIALLNINLHGDIL